MSDTVCPGSAMASRRFRSIASTHIGAVRTVNEDRVLNCPDQGLWAVADGMGGHSLGDKAAISVVRALATLTAEVKPIDRHALVEVLDGANASVFAEASAAGHTCGSTVAGLFIADERCIVFWAGDSRVYRLRSGSMTRMTHDHRLVQELVDASLITEAQARGHPQGNVITRAIGVAAQADVDFVEDVVVPGDVYLICSDGLTDLVVDTDLQDALKLSPETAAEKLIKAALNAGGTDNISVVVITIADWPS